MAKMTVPALREKYHLAETTLRDAIKRGAFPAEKIGRDYIVDDETQEFQTWLEEHQNQSRVKGEQRKAVPLLALGAFAAEYGIALSHRRDRYDVDRPLTLMLEITEKEGNNPGFARAAVKGELERLLQGKVAPSVIGQYVDLFYDTVLGEPLQQTLLRFLQRERMMKAAYVQAYLETQQELSGK